MNRPPQKIEIKTPSELAIMRQGGRILAKIIDVLSRSIEAGMTTADIDVRAEALMKEAGVTPAFKGYRGFPACTCISVNEEVVHGIPGARRIQPGDLVSVDVGIVHEGFYSDTAVTIAVPPVSPQARLLLEVTQRALRAGIGRIKSGARLGDVSAAVQKTIEEAGLAVVREFVGHGIGRRLHEDPEVPNFGKPGEGIELREGMVIAIEPMVNLGDWRTRVAQDGWTVVTADGSLSAHFEHTVVVTETGAEILTRM